MAVCFRDGAAEDAGAGYEDLGYYAVSLEMRLVYEITSVLERACAKDGYLPL